MFTTSVSLNQKHANSLADASYGVGDVEYVSQTNATESKLAYVNDNGVAIIKVDNTTFVPWNDKRDSVRAN